VTRIRACAWLLALLLPGLHSGTAAAQSCRQVDLSASAWPAATERDADNLPLRRFIPPELYAGAPWAGERELVLRPMQMTHRPDYPRDHPPIGILYPAPLPGAPEVMALQRTRRSGRQGLVEQYFAINERGDGLGRLTDLRQHRQRATMAECFKFPLGVWQQGETRQCRESTIRILEIDFVHNCVPHALKFRWNDEGTYVFAPGLGMVSVEH
jgi:hypothetical protein